MLPVCKKKVLAGSLKITNAVAECTGTYTCAYNNAKNLLTSVHIYVKDPNNLFVPMQKTVRLNKKEGEDCLLQCLLTDPSATNFSLLMENGTRPPQGMVYTADPRKGILIRNLKPSYSADYVCTARINGNEMKSKPFVLDVSQTVREPPHVSLETDEYVRIVGEMLQIVCLVSAPSISYTVKWKHTSNNNVTTSAMVKYGSFTTGRYTLTILMVKMTDTGNYTCESANEAGVKSATTFLQVVERPYIRLLPQLPPNLSQNGTAVTVKEAEDVTLKVLIQAYPQIQEKGWSSPLSHKISEEGSFVQYNNKYEAVLLLQRIKAEEQGQYTFYASNIHANSSINFFISIYQKPFTLLRKENPTTFICTSSGYPAPKIFWRQCLSIRTTCSENETELLPAQLELSEEGAAGSMTVKSVFTLEKTSHVMTVECVARNLVGEARDTLTTEVSCAIKHTVSKAVYVLQNPKYEIRWKIIETSDGTSFIDPMQLPYKKTLEFPRDKLKLGKVLGAGAFGKVVEATAYGLGKEDSVMQVAVKMLKPTAWADEREALMSELKILCYLGQHDNIVNLLGACTEGGPMLMITEYCCHGDLQNFLRNKAETFLDFVMSMQVVAKETSDYKNVFTKTSSVIRRLSVPTRLTAVCDILLMLPGSSCEENEVDTWPLDMEDLLKFSYQVAQGLEFLASKNCIHRDVAARNVLLADCRVAKICDFGLARDIMNDSNYVVKGNARLPVKWMAPESIFDCVYTVQSDVWSYGVLLWEIFSLGKNPYPGIPVDTIFYEMIRDGYQMAQPEFAPQEIYKIIKMCWNLDPTDRPTFQNIVQLMESLLYDHPLQIYQNEPRIVLEQEPGSCDAGCDRPSELSRNREEEGQLLLKSNHYQFC
ncbi:macrophage colony-stimulating factor 1 receptor 1-like [Arapaima gigas]